jgi:protein-tyrosine phosphatase
MFPITIGAKIAMIDTHSHILPGLDDGPASLQEALDLIAQAAGQGVTDIFATPHCCDGVYNCDKEVILEACRILSAEAEKIRLDIRILPGAEIRVNHDLMAQFDAGRLLTLGDAGKFLLLELPPMFIVPAVLRMIQQLKERGVTSIIAHAERNPMIMARPELAADFIFQGARLQITAASLTGDFGRGPLKTAKMMARNDQIFCLGSDIHPGRKYRMQAAEKKLMQWAGRAGTGTILEENPKQILTGCFDVVQSLGPGKVGI